ncbi:S9 family peptidase [Candidatus Halobonum tyrrellensis]|uniref:Peptidase S9 prolyl oligopeptidase active site domain-containing protein n=1 Tax=Candidatus Halobonum tyrrellensis G22 TaxID=1324957 RepID=V4HM04_9EURY|nr:prolyl oligopeptidase family serine peptidase [Candidatus Halobonum tyrrellensis]ESP88954.1 peptidase S9 prolyl oligopeptidase active site domain-containing protein [Candidatus Halobonum tyrrellensis G22]
MSLEFTVDDALDLRTVAAPAWNADATRVGYLRTADGETRFAHGTAAPDPDPTVLDRADAAGFDWRPEHPDEAAVVADGDLLIHDAGADESRTLAASEADHANPTWADADTLCYVRGGSVWRHDLASGGVRELFDRVRATPFGAAPLAVSPDGRYLASVRDAEAGGRPGELVAYDLAAGERAWSWRPDAESVVPAYDWADDATLVYALDATDASARRYRAVDVTAADADGSAAAGDAGDPGDTLLSETTDVVSVQPDPVGNGEGRVALLSDRDGYAHLYVVDVAARRAAVGDGGASAGEGDGDRTDDAPGYDGDGVVQVTAGAFEARGDALDAPAWSPDGDRVAFATNETDPGERRLHVADATGAVEHVADAPGTVLRLEWGADGRLACLRAGRKAPADVCVYDPEAGDGGEGDASAGGGTDDPTDAAGDGFARVSDAYPDRGRLADFPDPEPVSFDGTGGETVRGYLYAPPDAAAGDDRPAVVWCHGGPVRQMRRGFHHMRSYGGFHLFNHALLARGYVVCELNYRGGIGYGHAFEQGIAGAFGVDEVDDCARAAEFLRDRPEVGDRVGLWGLSYGGFLANAVATGTDAYDAAVNFAGIWDWAAWVEYAASFGWGAARRFAAQLGGYPDEPGTAAAYERASPYSSAAGLDTPLFALHGTDDPNVDFEQMDLLVEDLVGRGLDFETAYYPGENHMFERPETWRDALGRVLPFLDEHLRDGEAD